MFTIRRSTANDVSSNIECEVIRTTRNEFVSLGGMSSCAHSPTLSVTTIS